MPATPDEHPDSWTTAARPDPQPAWAAEFDEAPMEESLSEAAEPAPSPAESIPESLDGSTQEDAIAVIVEARAREAAADHTG